MLMYPMEERGGERKREREDERRVAWLYAMEERRRTRCVFRWGPSSLFHRYICTNIYFLVPPYE